MFKNGRIVIIGLVLFMGHYFYTMVYAAETCSRTAIINYQEVLIDNNSTQKGEGLRYYLDKDKVAKQYLDVYQEGLQNKTINAFLGTVGTLLIFSGFLVNESRSRKRTLLIGGASVMAINFLVAKTIEHRNEGNLHRGIEEYNKRNLPRIYFNAVFDEVENYSLNGLKGIGLGITSSF